MKQIIFFLLLCLPLWTSAQPLIEKAREHYIAKDWKKARLAYEEITAANPYHGAFWYRLGYASLRDGQYQQAIRSSRKAIELGVAATSAMYNIGSSYALQKKPERAMEWLEKAVEGGYRNLDRMRQDKDLKSLRKMARFQQLTSPQKVDKTDRIKGWRWDLDYLTRQMRVQHLNLHHTVSVADWNRKKQIIYDSIPFWSDLEITGALIQLVATVQDGHTVLYPPFHGQHAFQALPLDFYEFKDGLFIRAAEEKYGHLVGTKVLRVGNCPIDQVLEDARTFLNRDNEMTLKWLSPLALMLIELHQLIGCGKSGKAVQLTLLTTTGDTLTTTVDAGPLRRDPMSRFAPSHWKDSFQSKGQLLWTKNPDDYYWYEYLEDRQVVYCQFNQIRDKEEQSIAAFSQELFQFIDAHPVDALILDIRLNNGGNNFLNKAFIHELIRSRKINQRGKLFTIIGRRTFSAAMNLASDLENHTSTVFVGEPTGSRPNFYGEDNPFTLPYSGLTGSISSRYWQGGATSDDVRNWIAPHLVAELTAEQYRKGKDPALEAIFRYLGR